MPALYAHDRFGAKVSERLEGELREIVTKYYTQFSIGLQGPDIFFFYKPYTNNKIVKYGNHLHHISAMPFFHHAISVVKKKGRNSREYAYLMGFICHFILDSECHPYVEEMIGKTGVQHLEIEEEFEKLLLRMDDHDAFAYPLADLVPTDVLTAVAIYPFYSKSMTPGIVRTSLRDYLAGNAGISEVNYLAYWGYAASVSTVIVALIGPVLGAIADTRNFKKPLFTLTMMVGVIGCAALSFPNSWILFLAIFVIAKVGYNASLIFYDSMLVDVTTPEQMDTVSSHGYAWGYIGSCIPFVISLVLVLMYDSIGITMHTAMMLAFFLNGAWWLLVTIPLLKNYEQKNYIEMPDKPVRSSFKRLGNTLKDIKKQKNIFLYLLSFFFFIDGVYTIIEMATAYGSALGLDSQGLLLALLVTQLVAFPCALIFSKFSKKYETDLLIKVCIIAYTGIALFAIQLDKQWEFWLLAVLVGMFQGAIQALSRSYFAKIIPADKSGEYFGIYDICGKGASFMGTTLVGIVAQVTHVANAGVAIISVMFVIGFVFFCKAAKLNKQA